MENADTHDFLGSFQLESEEEHEKQEERQRRMAIQVVPSTYRPRIEGPLPEPATNIRKERYCDASLLPMLNMMYRKKQFAAILASVLSELQQLWKAMPADEEARAACRDTRVLDMLEHALRCIARLASDVAAVRADLPWLTELANSIPNLSTRAGLHLSLAAAQSVCNQPVKESCTRYLDAWPGCAPVFSINDEAHSNGNA